MAFYERHKSVLLLAGLLFLASPATTRAWVQNNGYSWATGSDIVMHLQLTKTVSSFIDGSGSWNASATEALNAWNQHLDTVRFVAAAPASTGAGDGTNSVFFSSYVYGEAFGEYTLAVTIGFNSASSPKTIVETDVIFNSAERWNSYRGPLRSDSRGVYTFDFRRVALHEFGHVLGLDHPDKAGQSVTAQMNSLVSDLDSLVADDIAGAKAIYSPRITSSSSPPSVRSGDNFSYQITSSHQATSFSAAGLPSCLQLEASTGVISGRCVSTGTFNVDVVAERAGAVASGRVQIAILPLPLTSSPFVPATQIGDEFVYQITASNNPTSYSATGLPPGLQIDTATGRIYGVATAVGDYSVTVKAIGATAEAGAVLRIVVAAPRITSPLYHPAVDIGRPFSYQITASNRPSRFSATGLPPGLQVNGETGLISGTVTISGDYRVNLTAAGAVGEATGVLAITVTPLSVADEPAAVFTTSPQTGMVADSARRRLYVADGGRLLVIDTASLAVIATVSVMTYGSDMAISADGNRLWIAGNYSRTIRSVDLNTLQVLPEVTAANSLMSIREGVNRQLYGAGSSEGGVFQINPDTGATIARFAPSASSGSTYLPNCHIEISADRQTLFVLESGYPPQLARYALSGTAPPALLQKVPAGTQNSYVRRLALSPDGRLVAAVTQSNSTTVVDPTFIRAAGDLASISATLTTPGAGSHIAFSADSSMAIETILYGPQVLLFNAADGKLARTITLPERAFPSGLMNSIATDGNFLFIAGSGNTGYKIYAFPIRADATAPASPRSLLNVSTRLRTNPGDGSLIGGFIVAGSEPKRVVLRAMGPSLPVNGALADPVLELRNGQGELVRENDNWNSHRADLLATRIPPAHEREAAISAQLEPGSYTAVVRAASGNESGVALVELFDLEPQHSRVANISTRGRVEAGDDVMIGGFIIGGDQPTRVIVRAIGPSLGNSGVAAALPDPTLALHDGNGSLVAANDDWTAEQEQEISDTTIPPRSERESAIVRTLPPGSYTAIVRGKNDSRGVALVEVYNLEPN